jgi:hypothetical protein
MTTRKEKERAYTVLMYALSEERRVCGMDEATFIRRHREILEDCGLHQFKTDDAAREAQEKSK